MKIFQENNQHESHSWSSAHTLEQEEDEQQFTTYKIMVSTNLVSFSPSHVAVSRSLLLCCCYFFFRHYFSFPLPNCYWVHQSYAFISLDCHHLKRDGSKIGKRTEKKITESNAKHINVNEDRKKNNNNNIGQRFQVCVCVFELSIPSIYNVSAISSVMFLFPLFFRRRSIICCKWRIKMPWTHCVSVCFFPTSFHSFLFSLHLTQNLPSTWN